MMTAQLRIELSHFACIFRAMNGDKEAQAIVTWSDCEGLEWAPTFGEFYERNKSKVQLYEATA